jgi:hypothetical protein
MLFDTARVPLEVKLCSSRIWSLLDDSVVNGGCGAIVNANFQEVAHGNEGNRNLNVQWPSYLQKVRYATLRQELC